MPLRLSRSIIFEQLISYPYKQRTPDQSTFFRMSYRFFHAQPPVDARFTLAGDQAHHAINVMRYQLGDRIVIFDGQGTEHDAEIESLTKKQLTARLLESRQLDRSLDRCITMAVALPKGDRQKFLIEKLVELGVTNLIPLATTRSVAEVKPKVVDRIEKHVIEASKQCGRNFLMNVSSQVSVSQLCKPDAQSKAAITQDARKLLAHPYDSAPLASLSLDPSQPVAIAIGPEGGFTDSEVTSLTEAGWEPTRFGPTILRVETAAIAAASIFGIGKLGD